MRTANQDARDFDAREDSLSDPPREESIEWQVAYETAVVSRWETEDAAWLAHDVLVIRGLNPDKLAVVTVRK